MLLVTAVLVAGGCQSEPVPVGEQRLGADWGMGTLGVNLGPEVAVMAAAAAGEQTLLQRGYVIVGRTVSEDRSVLVGRYPSGDAARETVFVASGTGQATRLEVHVSPLGDPVESAAVLDGAVRLLGR